jgi:hypothetical protein
MASSAQLDIRVKTTGIDKAKSKLKGVTAEGKKTQAQVSKLETGFKGFGRNASAAVAAIDGPLGGVSSRISALTTIASASTASITAMALAVTGLGFSLANGVSELDELNAQLAKTEALLKATGNASGFTSKELRANAEAVALNTLASVKDVADAQAKLLTFNRIQGEVSKQAVILSQDLATVFGGTIASQATQLGKALQDPVKGITALNRVGVSFTNTQREQIKLFVEGGEVAKAQTLILKALSEQVGGAGAAVAGSTLTGALDSAGQKYDKFSQLLADKVGALEITKRLVRGLNNELDRFNELLEPKSAADLFSESLAKLEELNAAQQRLDNATANQVGGLSDLVARLSREYDDLRGKASGAAKETNADIKNKTKAILAEIAARKKASEEDKLAARTETAKKAAEQAQRDEIALAKLIADTKLRAFQEQNAQEAANFEQAQALRLKFGEAEYQNVIAQQERLKAVRQKDFEEQQEYLQASSSLAAGAGNLFASITDALKKEGDEQSKAYQVAFALQKGFAVATASLNFSGAVMKAFNDPSAITFPQQLANYGAALATGGQLISAINSATYTPGRLQGGDVTNGVPTLVGERGPELLVPNSSGSIISNSKRRATGGSEITIINQTTGRVDRTERQTIGRQEIITIIEEVMPAVASDANSDFSKAQQTQTTANRVLR